MTDGELTDPTARLRSRLRQVLAMLGAEFLLGMGANLVGLPSEVTGSARVVTQTLIGLHALLAIGIVTVAILVSRSARAEPVRRRTTPGMASLIVAFVAGLGTLMSGSGWLSFVMASGFLAAAGLYGIAYVETTKPAQAL